MSDEGDKPAESESSETSSEAMREAVKSADRKPRALSGEKKLAFGVVLLLGFLIAQELVLRLLFPVPEIANFNRVQYSQMFHDGAKEAGQGKFLANASYIHASDPDDGAEFVHSLNLYGFRDRQWTVKKPAGMPRIMFLGDSFVEGAMASDEYTIPEGFRASAEDKGERLDTMNMGIQAMGLPGYMFLMADAVPVFKPDVVFIVFFENDFYSPPAFHPQLMDGRLHLPEVNSAWTPRLLQLIRNISADRPIAYRWHSSPFSFFAALPDRRNPFADPRYEEAYSQIIEPELVAAMKKGRFNPYIVDEYFHDERELRKPINVSSYLMAYKEFLGKHGCQMFTAYIPLNLQVSDYYLPFALKFSRRPVVKSLTAPEYQIHREALATQCDVLDIPFLDLTPILKSLEDQGKHLYWDYDNHMRGEAYFLIGSELYDWFASRRTDNSKE